LVAASKIAWVPLNAAKKAVERAEKGAAKADNAPNNCFGDGG
jgi:hypothetical protein